jgi:hypothetical protein
VLFKSYSWNEPMFGSLLLGDVSSSSVYPGGHGTRFASCYTSLRSSWTSTTGTLMRPFRLTSSQNLQIQLILHSRGGLGFGRLFFGWFVLFSRSFYRLNLTMVKCFVCNVST